MRNDNGTKYENKVNIISVIMKNALDYWYNREIWMIRDYNIWYSLIQSELWSRQIDAGQTNLD